MPQSLFERLKADASVAWSSYTQHEFVEGLGNGQLPEGAFRTYLVQDYLFLVQFARAYALAVTKARSLADMRRASAGLSAILDVEMDLHIKLSAAWGLTAHDLENTAEEMETIAYTRFVLDAGHSGDLLDMMTALAPCMIGYAEIGERLATRPGALGEGNPYAAWISEYASDEYRAVAQAAREHLDELAEISLTEKRYPVLLALFERATWLEADFWQMGLDRPTTL
jgi:thiaminase/transcriptional activator TenA